MNRWIRGVLCGALLVALVACAHGNHAPPTQLSFPTEFNLLQVIEVEQGDLKMTFLASLRRQGRSFELAMLDPVLQRPIYEAHSEGERFVETRPLPDEARGLGVMLFQSLKQFFEATSFRRSADTAGAVLRFTGERFEFEFDPWDEAANGCPFPREIRMQTRGNPRMRVVATTEDIACGVSSDVISSKSQPLAH